MSWACGTTWPSSGLTWSSTQASQAIRTARAPCYHPVSAPGLLCLPRRPARAQSASHSVGSPVSGTRQALGGWLCVRVSRQALMCHVCTLGHGDCHCGECKCHAGYIGDNCNCSTDISTCQARDGQICSDRGHCVCGQCQCTEPGAFGETCEKCPTCLDACSTKR